MVAFNFNASQYAPRYSAADGLPPGKHPVIISASEFRPTKNSTASDPSSMLVLTLEAIDGPAKGGKQTDRLLLQHANQQTVNIAYGQLAAYCAVTGKQGFGDTSELHNIPFMIEVGPQKNNADYSEVKGVYFIDGRDAGSAPAPAQQPAPQPTQPAQPMGQPIGYAPAPAPQPAAAPQFQPGPQFAPQPAPAGSAPPWARQ